MKHAPILDPPWANTPMSEPPTIETQHHGRDDEPTLKTELAHDEEPTQPGPSPAGGN
jgi:hypothetical protein